MNDTPAENDSVETPPSARPAVPELTQLRGHLHKVGLYREDVRVSREASGSKALRA